MAAVLASPAGADEPWYAHYVRAMGLLENGEAAAARAELEQALALRPEPGLGIKPDGLTSIDYLPHLYLAVSARMSGDEEAAGEHFRQAEAAGVAALSEGGALLLESYRPLLGPRSSAPAAPPAVLEQPEHRRLGHPVAGRCGPDPAAEPDEAPWYVLYEQGLALARRGDPRRALGALTRAADRQPDPGYRVRVYGVWFMDYLPYFEIARLHAELGNWRCASDALELSERRSELSPEDPRVAEAAALKKEIADQLFF